MSRLQPSAGLSLWLNLLILWLLHFPSQMCCYWTVQNTHLIRGISSRLKNFCGSTTSSGKCWAIRRGCTELSSHGLIHKMISGITYCGCAFLSSPRSQWPMPSWQWKSRKGLESMSTAGGLRQLWMDTSSTKRSRQLPFPICNPGKTRS